MKDVVQTILEHPFATIFIIGAFTMGVSDIILSAKGIKPGPWVSLSSTKAN